MTSFFFAVATIGDIFAVHDAIDIVPFIAYGPAAVRSPEDMPCRRTVVSVGPHRPSASERAALKKKKRRQIYHNYPG